MMAKMFYTLDETKTALGRDEEEVKQLAREGRLREFRDGPRLMFKADQVDQLKAELGGGAVGAPDLGGSDSAALNLDGGAPSGSGMVTMADAGSGSGLGGSAGGVPSPGHPGTGTGLSSGGAGGSRSGITVFDVDDQQKVDPSAQTVIQAGIQDQMQIDSVGSGSGLLDLTRETDDTSLGAQLLDEIAPSGGQRANRPPAMAADAALDLGDIEPQGSSPLSRATAAVPVFIEARDPLADAFGFMALAGVAIIIFSVFVLANAVFNVHPQFVSELSGKPENKGMLWILGGGILAVAFFGIGWFIGKSRSASR